MSLSTGENHKKNPNAKRAGAESARRQMDIHTVIKNPTITEQRLAALAAGKPRFNTSAPCDHGHKSDRYTSGGECVTCVHLYSTRHRDDRINFLKTEISRVERKYAKKKRSLARDLTIRCLRQQLKIALKHVK